ncbi:MAG: hypothetical protein IJO57_03755 [Bacilli bacterium]|nr:hypothetical protein [Bacilli bacterium]
MEDTNQTLTLDKKILILSQASNYYARSGIGNNREKMRNGRAVKLLSNISDEEAQILFNIPEIQNAIFNIDNTEILRTVFRKVPAFFQEIMFKNEKIQDSLLAPRQSLKRKELFESYRIKDIVFKEEELRQLENFLHTIKSPKIYDKVIESKYFQRIVALCFDNQLKKSFFRGMDEVKLFYNIINDDEIFKTRVPRRRNILTIFNNVSNHILLSDDYNKFVNPREFIIKKRWKSATYEKVIVDKRTLSLMSTEMIQELLEFENIDTNFIKEFLEKDILESLKSNNYDFNKIFSHLLQGGYSSFNGVDYIYFNVLIDECKKNETAKKQFIDFVYRILCNTQELDENEITMIKDELYNRMKTNSISKGDYKKLFYSPDSLKTMFYLKFGKTSSRMDYLNGISFKQIMLLNVKHINQILKLLNIDNEDEMSNIYGYAIKLYLTFGLERTLKILNGDYGRLNRTFFDNVSFLKVDGIKLTKEGNKYIPNISNEFINFMFANQKNNHFIDMLNNPYGELNKYWSYLYNNFDDLKEKCHGVMTLKKLNIIFKQLSPSRDINDVSPDNYKLKENDILNDICLGNKTRMSNGEIYKSVLDIYEQMKRRTESSIPYVKGYCSNGYSYEMMKLNDPIAFTLGYKGNCCIRTRDIAHKHLLHATLCRNGRILIIYDENNEIAGFVPLKRNGEVLIANSIECTHKIRNEKAIKTFSEAVKDIVSISQSNKDENSPINLVCIGTEAYAKPNGTPFPVSIKTPTIYEKNDITYGNTDQYHINLTIIYKNPTLDLTNIKYGNPRCSYQDPRPLISSCDFIKSSTEEQEKALKIINAVRYANSDLEELENFKICRGYGMNYCVYNDDWYILTTYDGNIYGDYLKYDERAINEYNVALEELKKQFCQKYQQTGSKLVKKLY